MKIPKTLFWIFLLFNCENLAFSEGRLPNHFQEYIKKTIMDHRIPGLSISVVKGDSLVFAKGFGVRKYGEKDSVDAQTLFQVASVTKSFTATLIAMLVDQGKAKWDDPVIQHIPDFKLKDAFVANSLTIRDALAMRSGILGGDTLKASNRKDLIRLLFDLRISPLFRTTLTSPNCSFTIAGHIVEKIKSRRWDDILKEELLIPLQMPHTFTDISSALASTHPIAVPHIAEGGSIVPRDWENFDLMAPADAILSNVLDLSNWVKFQIQEGSFNNKSIVRSETIKEMQKSQAITPDWMKDLFNPIANFSTLGLGCIVSEYKGHKIVEMWGGAEGSNALVTTMPEIKLGIVILANLGSAFEALRAVKYYIYDIFLSAEMEN